MLIDKKLFTTRCRYVCDDCLKTYETIPQEQKNNGFDDEMPSAELLDENAISHASKMLRCRIQRICGLWNSTALVLHHKLHI